MDRETGFSHISKQQAIKLAVLRSFTRSPERLDILLDLSLSQWKRLLHWLDISGLALYFLARLQELGVARRIPGTIHDSLQHRLADNRERMAAVADEDLALQVEFQRHNLRYATLKGFSLRTHSVPSFELRSQLDLDFLIAPEDLACAQDILIRRGYHLRGQCGRSWEYKDEPIPRTSIKMLYQHTGSRSAELHVADTPASQEHLRRRHFLERETIHVPVLAPEDLFLGQALHLYKHLAADGARASHGVELYRHILHRREDTAFWIRLRALTEKDRHVRFALGFVIRLLTDAMGDFAPEALTSWTSECLPPFADRWIHRFGLSAVLGRAGGSKLSMILLDELEAHGLGTKAPKPRKLLPTRLPPKIERPVPGETMVHRLSRNARQIRFILHRLRFHVVEGARLTLERRRWKSTGARPQQTGDNPLTHA